MSSRILRTPEVWAQLLLEPYDEQRVREFLSRECRVATRSIVRRMHLTVYHCRRAMPALQSFDEPANVIVPAVETRFMVMAPGGENPRPELDPARKKVGVRVRRNTPAMSAILSYRERLLAHETASVLGARRPSDHRRNAFGARHFQAHLSLLRAGSGIDRDLKAMGEKFRDAIGSLTFDRFQVDLSFLPPDAPGPLSSRPASTDR